MRRLSAGICTVGALAIAVLVGCRGGKPEPVAAPERPATPTTPVVATKPVDLPMSPSGEDEAAAAGTDAGGASAAAPSGSGQDESPASSPAVQYGKERIVLLAPTNPIVIEFQLSIDGQPHTAALEKLVDEVLKIADTDGDGRTMWKELCACKRIKYGQFGNLAIDDENGEKQIIDRYDIARDGVVSRAELPRFLTRNAGGSRSFSIRGTLDHRDLNRRGAFTWRVIDADDDGVISAEERTAAAARLASRDNDDDEILLPSDLNPRLQVPDPEMMMAERRRRGPDAARLLGPHADWATIQRSLEQEYGGGKSLRGDCFPLTPELFSQLDKNKDGRIGREEISALDAVPAHVVIAAEFGRAKETGDREQETGDGEQETGDGEQESGVGGRESGGPRLKLVSIDPALGSESSVVEQPGRLTLAVGGTLLTFYTNDTVASSDFAARAKQALEMFDQNKDGYLEKSEVPASLQGQLGRFEAVDADEDGKAYAYEIEAFLAQQQVGLRAQIHARATDSEDVLFTALDADHDERLDSREIEGAGARLGLLDKDGDGRITSEELAEVLMIGLARGSIENADATFAPPPVIARGPDSKAPRWFTAMDANRDGAVSRREFLGTAEKFAELDRDGNGLLDVTEAAVGGTKG